MKSDDIVALAVYRALGSAGVYLAPEAVDGIVGAALDAARVEEAEEISALVAERGAAAGSGWQNGVSEAISEVLRIFQDIEADPQLRGSPAQIAEARHRVESLGGDLLGEE